MKKAGDLQLCDPCHNGTNYPPNDCAICDFRWQIAQKTQALSANRRKLMDMKARLFLMSDKDVHNWSIFTQIVRGLFWGGVIVAVLFGVDGGIVSAVIEYLRK
jgi:hypothetical protein